MNPRAALPVPTITITPPAGVTLPPGAGAYTFVAGLDYNLDYQNGLIQFLSASPNAAYFPIGSTVTVTCKIYTTAMTVLTPSFRPIEGKILFVGTNDAGQRWRVEIWHTVWKIKSKLELIKDDFGKLDFDYDVQDEESAHPTQPYFKMEQIPDGQTGAVSAA